jgi:hopanoid C-3 methylase HpnR
MDPAASTEFSRGCPWDCSFCSAWTFYGRSYRLVSPERVIEDLQSVEEPGLFIVDDVAFVQDKHGFAIGEEIARRGIKKKFYLETRGDVLLRHKEVFKFWKTLGMQYMFLGIEAIDEEGLKKFRKRTSLGENYEALEFARSLGIKVAINLIADPDWDEARFRTLREWCAEIPEIVNISINTPYPGTESWITEQHRLNTRDYRLFDIQHVVMPTRMPLEKFYRELLETQRVLYSKHLSWRTATGAMRTAARLMLRGQTNFVRGMMRYSKVFNLEKLMADHAQPVRYEMPPAPPIPEPRREPLAKAANLYVHAPRGRASRHIDDRTETFVDETRRGVS